MIELFKKENEDVIIEMAKRAYFHATKIQPASGRIYENIYMESVSATQDLTNGYVFVGYVHVDEPSTGLSGNVTFSIDGNNVANVYGQCENRLMMYQKVTITDSAEFTAIGVVVKLDV